MWQLIFHFLTAWFSLSWGITRIKNMNRKNDIRVGIEPPGEIEFYLWKYFGLL